MFFPQNMFAANVWNCLPLVTSSLPRTAYKRSLGGMVYEIIDEEANNEDFTTHLTKMAMHHNK